jgi:diaminohydroxyphosphoribosylaminopyrimidine deaminase/5-amino-6-(5-phosphoribosylamino)uracil reductase
MRAALRLARRARGQTSPNPLVGAVLVRGRRIIGRGWHHQAGAPHAEIEALRDADRRGQSTSRATLYVTLEPCCTHGRTPPCTEAIIHAGIKQVVAAATDPNPAHRGRGFRLLRRAGVRVTTGVLAAEAVAMNPAFNHWIAHGTPLVTVKSAMTLDGKIATAQGESKWITGPPARARAMELRRDADAILVGVQTVRVDDPALTVRSSAGLPAAARRGGGTEAAESAAQPARRPRRIVLDAMARTPPGSQVLTDRYAELTTIVVSPAAPPHRVKRLARLAKVLVAPARKGMIDLRWLLRRLGAEEVTSLLVEGGGEVNASFLARNLAQQIAFFYAPKVLGGRTARKAVGGTGAANWVDVRRLEALRWERLGRDLLLTARLQTGGGPERGVNRK